MKLMWFVASDKIDKAAYDVKRGAARLLSLFAQQERLVWYVNLFMSDDFFAIYDKGRNTKDY